MRKLDTTDADWHGYLKPAARTHRQNSVALYVDLHCLRARARQSGLHATPVPHLSCGHADYGKTTRGHADKISNYRRCPTCFGAPTLRT